MRRFPTIRSCVMGGALVAGAVAGISGVAGAAAGEPATGSSEYYLQRGLEAQSQAEATRKEAATLDSEAPTARQYYKMQQVNQQAATEEAKANELFAQAGVPSCQKAPPSPPPSPELQKAEERLERLRESGGWAYKTGAVARAEADVRELTPATP